MTQQQSKPNYMQRTSMKGIKTILRASSSGDQGDCTTKSHRHSTKEVHTTTQGVRKDPFKKQRQKEASHKQWKDKETNPKQIQRKKSQKKMLNEIEASQLADIQFKAMLIRKLNELSVNYKKLQGNYEKLITNYISIKKDIETINKGQEE